MSRTDRTNGAIRYRCIELAPRLPRQLCAMTLVQQHIECSMRSHLLMHRHNAYGLIAGMMIGMAGHVNAFDRSAAHEHRIRTFGVQLNSTRWHSVLQLLLIAAKRLPDKRTGRRQLTVLIEDSRNICGRTGECCTANDEQTESQTQAPDCCRRRWWRHIDCAGFLCVGLIGEE